MKPCKHCATPFTPQRPLQAVCSPRCAGRYVKEQKKAEAVQTRERRAAMKTIPQLIKEAQHAFNAYIRERDKYKPCICCGASLVRGGSSTGGEFDCGHWRSVGSASHLRFDERNAHGQRKVCNRYGAGRAVEYRAGLIDRIGASEVEALEADNRTHKWQRDELIAIRATYIQKLKDLKRETA